MRDERRGRIIAASIDVVGGVAVDGRQPLLFFRRAEFVYLDRDIEYRRDSDAGRFAACEADVEITEVSFEFFSRAPLAPAAGETFKVADP